MRVLRTLAALLPPVVLSIGAAVGGLALVRHYVPISTLHQSSDAAGNYLQTLGTIYAVLLAFVVFVVWNQFNEARSYVEKEANELLDLYRTAAGFDPDVARPLKHALRDYASAVLAREWSAMACLDDGVIDGTTAMLDEVWKTLAAIEPRTECHRALFDEMLVRFNDLSDARTLRLSASRTRIPLALNILLYAGAVIVVASMCLLEVQDFTIHAVMIGALAGAVSHVLYVIGDLDNAFSGDWQVPRTAFVDILRYMERDIAR